MNIIIKSLCNNPIEIKNVQKFLFKQIKNEFGYGYVPEWHKDIINLESYYINPSRNNFFVAFNQNEDIVATIGLRAYDKDFEEFKNRFSNKTTSSIWRLFVDKRYRRCGLASKMVNIAENFAYDAGFDDIYLHTHKTLPGALEFWRKMGFLIILDSNNNLQTVHMDKKIKSLDLSPIQSIFNYALEF